MEQPGYHRNLPADDEAKESKRVALLLLGGVVTLLHPLTW